MHPHTITNTNAAPDLGELVMDICNHGHYAMGEFLSLGTHFSHNYSHPKLNSCPLLVQFVPSCNTILSTFSTRTDMENIKCLAEKSV